MTGVPRLDIGVLYVEDDPNVQMIVSMLLEQRVERLWTAESVEDGIELFQKHRPDLVFADIILPDGSGLEMVRRIRQEDPAARCIVMSAHEETNYFLDAIDVGVRGFLLKPVDVARLDEMVRDMGQSALLERRLRDEEADRRAAEESLRNERNLFVHGPVVICKWSRQAGRYPISYISPNCEEILGYPREEILSQPTGYFSKIWRQDRKMLLRQVVEFSHTGDANCELEPYRIVRPGGKVIWVKEYLSAVRNEDGEVQDFLGYVVDITDQKRVEEELKVARDQAERAVVAKSEFLANMSHEIRTPLNAVLGFTELLNSQITDKRHRSYLDSIGASGKSLLTLINDILDLSKIEAGRMELQYEPVSLHSLCQEVRNIFSLKLHERQLEFILDISPDIPSALLLDEVRLRQILFNLVGNAVKFTEHGYIKLTVERGQRLPDSSSIELVLTVEDTGIGIPLESQKKVFESFRQQDGQSTKKYGGTGLGLAITSRLVEMMNGEIRMSSILGKGTSFEIVLHEVVIAAIAARTRGKASFDCDMIEFEPATVLVVDDVEVNRNLVREYLRQSNLDVLEAEDGVKAVEMAQSHEIDAIVMDIRMPVMDGREATELIKAAPGSRHIPVIALTASVLHNDIERIKRSGFDGFLSKPLQRTELVHELTRHLKWKQRERPEEEVVDLTMTDEAMRRLPTVIEALDGVLLQACEQAQGSGDLDEVSAFARSLAEHAVGIPVLLEYARVLMEQCDNFDIEQINMRLGEYGAMTDSLRELLEPPAEGEEQ